MAALHLNQVDQTLVHLAGQNHLNKVYGLLIGDTKAVYKLGFLPQFIHCLIDFRAAAVDQNHFHTDEPQKDNILHNLLFQLRIDHGIATVLNHNDFTAVLLDVGQRRSQNLCPLGIGKISFHDSHLTILSHS